MLQYEKFSSLPLYDVLMPGLYLLSCMKSTMCSTSLMLPAATMLAAVKAYQMKSLKDNIVITVRFNVNNCATFALRGRVNLDEGSIV